MKENKPIFPVGGKGTRGYKSHLMPYDEALKCIDDFRRLERHPNFSAAVESDQLFYNVSFHKAAVRRLLKQPGAKALKAYLAHHDGRDTIVMVATDGDGVDIKTIAMNFGHPCPPFCGIDT